MEEKKKEESVETECRTNPKISNSTNSSSVVSTPSLKSFQKTLKISHALLSSTFFRSVQFLLARKTKRCPVYNNKKDLGNACFFLKKGELQFMVRKKKSNFERVRSGRRGQEPLGGHVDELSSKEWWNHNLK